MKTVLIANRGEIARRISRTVRSMGMRTIAVYSEADAQAPYVDEADEAVLLGPAPPTDSYLDVDKLLEAADRTGADAVHPGYGFLAENASFARAVMKAGLVWVGPSPEVIELMGDKVAARNSMTSAGVPVARGTDYLTSPEAAVAAAKTIGYPVMVKASGGGGGIGMGIARDEPSLVKAFTTARDKAARFFGDAGMFLERYIEGARHVEVQIFGLNTGRVVALGERDCSVQRRHQKVAEETPSPGIGSQLRDEMLKSAVRAGEAIGYRNAGTVEFLVDPQAQEFIFLEMNTRLQVEHPVTEMVTGLDLVEQQLHVAFGSPPTVDLGATVSRGHAIEFRIYAEDPIRFIPSPGLIDRWDEPTGPGVRVDSGFRGGVEVTPHYDPLLAKLCVYGEDREQALVRARKAVREFVITGPKTNLPFFLELLENERFVLGDYDTQLLAK